jgi:hypothetical protein
MSGRAVLRRTAPWVLCGTALAMLGLSIWLRWLFPDLRPSEQGDWLEGAISSLGFAGIPVVGALIASRLPANPIGWLWCATGLAYAIPEVARPLVRVAGGPLWLAWVAEIWGFVSLLGLFVFVFLLFPTGRLSSHGWRWVARAAVTSVVLLVLAGPFTHNPDDPAAVTPWALRGAAGRNLGTATEGGVFVLFGLILAAMLSLILRFRGAGPVERRQLTWFLYATVVNAALLVLDVLGVVAPGLLDTAMSAASFALLPVAVGVAMLRYRLYEIDRIVSRTVSYGLLSAALIGLYLLVVALLRPLLEPLTGSSALAVAGSTLVVAAVFNPARRRLQAAVDRRFDRARYDAGRAVQDFATRLRSEVDLDEITAGLRDTVVDTVAPSRVAVWLRVRAEPGRSEP